MTPPGPIRLDEASSEISALIATLHRTGQRLEELTAGEVDTVADFEGRTFLLRSAQEKLREINSERQTAILNALPAHIALLDVNGRIVSVNESWRQFGEADAGPVPRNAAGVSYLDACDCAKGKDAAEAAQCAAGIRAVLSGALARFSMEYPCHSPAGQRWFVMTVSPLPAAWAGGAVVMHVDITERKRVEAVLSASVEEQRQLSSELEAEHARLVAAQRAAMVGNWETDLATMAIIWSAETHRIHETDPATFRPTHQDFLRFVHPEDRARVDAAFSGSLGQHAPQAIEHRLLLKSGIKFVEERWQAYFDAQGKALSVVGTCQDVTERRTNEEALHRFGSAMDATDDAIYMVDRLSMRYVHVNDTACRMQEMSREALLALGPEGALSTPRAELERMYDAIIDSGVPAKPVVMLRTRGDGSQFWVELRRHAQRAAQGWTIITLAREITAQREQAEKLLRFRGAMEVSGDGVLLVDRASMRYIDVNQTLCDLTGRSREELLGMTPMDVLSADRATLEREYDAIIADENCSASKSEGEYRRKDGSVIPIETRRRAFRTDTGWVIVGTARDITDRKAAENRIHHLNRVYAVLSGINTLIVRVRDRDELFRLACRIAVEQGGFRMSWIGIVDWTAMKVLPVASAGAEPDFLVLIRDRFSLDEQSAEGNNMSARAVREKKVIVSNDIRVDRPFSFRNARIEQGIRSIAVLPLLVSDEVVGILVLYAGEAGFFQEEELKLLKDLAGDIAFAIDHIAKRDRLDYLAYYDELTGLANRTLFLERLAQFARSADSRAHKLAVFMVDIERFRNINDSLGRAVGDVLLKQVAQWLIGHLGDSGLLARTGADQFAIILPEIRQPGNVAHLIESTLEHFVNHAFHLDGTVLRITAKLGAALYPDDGADSDTLVRNAEAALKKAKVRGEKYLFYTQTMTDAVSGKLTLENQLRQALEKEEFVLHYQPKINLASGELTGAEALIRWNNPRTGLVAPGHFIPVLEETGLVYEVGRWALRRAIEDYLRWRAAGLPAVRLAVNVSPLQLRSRDFVAEIGRNIGIDPNAPGGLELEITESLVMEDVRHSIASLQAIRDKGVSIAIDDFGTGFSSLSYLSKLPVDALKIDRSFIVDMMVGPDGLSLVSTIIGLAHALKLKVVAEGVETQEQSRLLRLLNCDEMQGFLFSKPVPADVFEARFLAAPAGAVQ